LRIEKNSKNDKNTFPPEKEMEITIHKLPLRMLPTLETLNTPFDKFFLNLEAQYYKAAINTNRNLADAARALGIKPHTFRKRLKAKFPYLLTEMQKISTEETDE
jgi:DNA-binding NtrC family response regulator